MSSSPVFTLNNGVKMPGLGFGTFINEGAKGETYKAVTCALETGYRHLDCAWFYKNEEEVGEAIRDFLKKSPNVKRSDLFVCTKVWNHLHEPEEVEWSIQSSLEKLQLDYVDLFLVHYPIAAEKVDNYTPKINDKGQYVIKKGLTENHEPTWRAMEQVHAKGKAKAIGVSNFTIPQLKAILSYAKVKPAVNQVEIHPFLPNTKLVEFCQSVQILPAAYSPLGSQNQVTTTGEQVKTDPTLNSIAEKGGNTLGQVLIAWGLKRGYVVLPQSSKAPRIESNFHLIQLSDEDFEVVNNVANGRHQRFMNMKDTFGYDVWADEE